MKLGFTREDIELILKVKGCYANDKSLIIDQLSAMEFMPELIAEKKAIKEKEA